MKADVRATWRLLKPHARPHAWLFAFIFLLGMLSAFGERAVLLLIEPAWGALWPTKETSVSAEDPEPGAEVAGASVESGLASGEAVTELTLPDATGAPVEPQAVPEEGISGLSLSDVGEPGFLDRMDELRGEVVGLMLGSHGVATDEQRLDLLIRVGIAVCVIAIFTGLCQYFFTRLSRWVALRMVVDLRMRLAKHLMRLSMRYHNSRQLGDLLSRISADVNTTLTVLNDAFRDLVREPLLAIVSLGLAFIVAPTATLIMLIALPTVVVPAAILSRKVRKGSSRSLTKLGSSVQVLSQMFQGVRTVKAFRAEERELERYREINEDYVHSTMKMVNAISMTHAWTLIFSHVGLAAVVVGIGILRLKYEAFADPGKMATFLLLSANSFNNIKRMTRMWTRVQESVGASERLQAILDEPEDLIERSGARTISGLGDGLRFESLSFSYPGGDRPALDEIELTVRPGETLALVGASGSGKSTFVDLVARFVDPTAGQITVDGVDLRDLSLDSWTAQYAMVSQTPFLFHATVEENIRYGRPGASRAEVEDAARAAGILEFVEALPEGWNTDVADMGARLSGGQRQRITIARAILKGAPLLLLDEATSALDTETEVQVQKALDRLMEGRTVIVIAHRLSTIRNADRIAVLEAGRLVELGTHEELLGVEGAYARLHAAQFRAQPLETS